MKVLVTGASGYAGSHIALALAARGHKVAALVRSGRGRLPVDAERRGDLEVLTGDLSSGFELAPSVDAIVHAAASSIWPGVRIDDMVRDNILATRRLIDQAKRRGTRSFIFLSSLSAFGRIESEVVDEATPIIDPDAYGMTKRLAEELLAAEGQAFNSLSIRLPGVVGRGSVRNWLTNAAAAAREGREIAFFNPDAPFNNAVHIDDLASFVAGLIERKWEGADTVTVASRGQISVAEAIRILVDAHGRRSKMTVKPASKRSFLVSNARAIERYGYDPMEIGELLRRLAAEKAA